MAKVRVKLKNAGFRALRNSSGVIADLDRRANQIAAATGGASGDYKVSSRPGRARGRASVVAVSIEARVRNHERNELLNAIDAGR